MARIDLAAMALKAGVKRASVRLRPIPPPSGLELSYRAALVRMLQAVRAMVRNAILPIAEEARLQRDVAIADDTKRLTQALDLLRIAVETRLTNSAIDMVERVIRLEGQRHSKRFAETVRARLGIDLSGVLLDSDIADEIALATRRNAGLIKSLGDDVLRRIEHTVTQSVIKGGTNRALSQKLQHELGIVRRRADTIARDQTAKLTSDLNEARQKQVGIARYIWRTSLDERVRMTHRSKEGVTFAWNDPPATGHPGEDVNCRCVAEGVVEF